MVLLRHVSVALSAAAAALGSALFLALNFIYQRKLWSPQAEYSMLTEVSTRGSGGPPRAEVRSRGLDPGRRWDDVEFGWGYRAVVYWAGLA